MKVSKVQESHSKTVRPAKSMSWPKLVVIAALALGFLVVGYYHFFIQESGEWWTAGGDKIYVKYGYSFGGDVLNYAIVRSWPANDAAAILDDPRTSFVPVRMVRRNSGLMYPIATNGTVYIFSGDKLRTMRVSMNEHSDTIGIMNCSSVEEVQEFFQKYEVQ